MGFSSVAGLTHRRVSKAATKVITEKTHGPNGSGSDSHREWGVAQSERVSPFGRNSREHRIHLVSRGTDLTQSY